MKIEENRTKLDFSSIKVSELDLLYPLAVKERRRISQVSNFHPISGSSESVKTNLFYSFSFNRTNQKDNDFVAEVSLL